MLEDAFYTENDLREFGFSRLGTNVRIAKSVCVVGKSNVSLGNNVRIDSYTILVATGEGKLHIGSHVHVGGHGYINATHGVCIEDFVNISQGCRLYSGSDDYSGGTLTNPTIPSSLKQLSTGPVRLEQHVIVGSGSVVLPNVCVGCGSAIGALSLVKVSLPPWGIYAGCPVRKIKDRSQELLKLELLGRSQGLIVTDANPKRS
jgi:acetyltransferase-like isoleucine patch superfamily enzyme